MGTNFYFKHANEEELEEDINNLKCKYPFAKITIQADIHIAKTSAGWKPLFQNNEYFESVEDIKNFYFNNFDTLIIKDEYGTDYTWEEFKKRVINFNPNGVSHIKSIKLDGFVTEEYINENYNYDKEGYEFSKGEWS